MFGHYNNIAIKGIETVFPKTIISNEDNTIYREEYGEKRIAKQIRLTGIYSCCVAHHETTEEMCAEAAEKLISRLGWQKDEIKGLILVTQTPSCIMPSTAFLIQKRLGLDDDCIAFDVNLGCSGYTTGLTLVSGILSNLEMGSKMILLVGDTITQYLKEDDIQNRMIFGDAGTATALEVVEDNRLIYMQKSSGQDYDKIYMKDSNDYFQMDGMEVFRYTINQVVGYIKEFMSKAKIADEDIDFYVFHQAQKYIIDNLACFCEIDSKKILISYDKYGNTSGASIPVTMYENANALKQSKKRVLMCGFGVGLSCSIVYGEVEVL